LRRLTLLIAEDNYPDVIVVREAIRLEDLPFEIHIASDGREAIAFLERAEMDPEAPCPHVLLLDLNLPKSDGFEVLRRLRRNAHCKDIPVLVMTSSDSPEDLRQAAELGASYFRKPPNYEEFLKIGGLLRKLVVEAHLIR